MRSSHSPGRLIADISNELVSAKLIIDSVTKANEGLDTLQRSPDSRRRKDRNGESALVRSDGLLGDVVDINDGAVPRLGNIVEH